MRRLLVAGILLCSLTGCDAETPQVAARGGTVVIGATGNYGSLFPPNGRSSIARQVTELVYDYLTEVGLSLDTFDDRTFAKRLAASWDWSSDSMSLAVHIDPRARWHDGRPVRSDDVAYSFSIYGDTARSSMASQLETIDSVTVADSLTAVFWFNRRYPLQFYDATSQMLILPRHIYGSIPRDSLDEATARIKPIGSGRYRFVSERSDESIEIAADTMNYRGSPSISRVIWRFFGSADEAARALLAGEVDIYDVMRPGDVQAAADRPDVKVVMSLGSDYAFMTFNTKNPLFASRDIRRALTMAVDRDAMVKNVFDSLASVGLGPTVRYFPTTSSLLKQLPYDTVAANRTLDSLGWRVDAKSKIRVKNGRKLSFRAILPSSSSNRIRMATLLQEQFQRVGVVMDPDQMEFTTFNTRLYKHDFDAALASWHLGTSPASVRVLWTSNAPQNLGYYSGITFDAQVDSAIAAFSPAERKSHYTRAFEAAIDDAPAIWLYEPKLVLGMHKRIRTKPYRPDAWWWSLADWSIPSSEKIPRDQVK